MDTKQWMELAIERLVTDDELRGRVLALPDAQAMRALLLEQGMKEATQEQAQALLDRARELFGEDGKLPDEVMESVTGGNVKGNKFACCWGD